MLVVSALMIKSMATITDNIFNFLRLTGLMIGLLGVSAGAYKIKLIKQMRQILYFQNGVNTICFKMSGTPKILMMKQLNRLNFD